MEPAAVAAGGRLRTMVGLMSGVRLWRWLSEGRLEERGGGREWRRGESCQQRRRLQGGGS